MKKGMLITILLISFLFMASCGANAYKDGTYEGEFVSESNNTTKVEITITEGEISDCVASFLDDSGNVKDENYAKGAKDSDYELGQIAVAGFNQYAKMLVEAGSIEEMDAVSGATVSFKEFGEAVKDALSKSQ